MTTGEPNPVVVFIADQPGMAARLIAEHADDGTGRCRVCSGGGQTGRYQWPCLLRLYAQQAQRRAAG